MREAHILFEKVTREEVILASEKCVGSIDTISDKFFFGINVSVLDITYEVDYTAQFIKEREIIETNQLDNYYDWGQAKVLFVVKVHPMTFFNRCLPSVVDSLAELLSKVLKSRCAIYIDDIPFSVYSSGDTIVRLEENYAEYFKREKSSFH